MAEPPGILGDIVRRKRADVAARLGTARLADMAAALEPSRRSLADALSRRGGRFIMEVKRASPSRGTIRPKCDPASIARGWAGTADAMSVLTDEPFFEGSFADLAAVRQAFDGPVLAKDFVIDPRQVAEARRHGADAVLAMLSVLEDEEVRAVYAAAEMLGMDVLTEVHDRRELDRALALGARIIGINNRDLKTLRVDLATTERLAPLVPEDRLLVAESGIGSHDDARRLAPHADAFLVGSSLMAADDPVRAGRRLAFGRVKLCGLTCAEDVDAAARAGASFAGLIAVPGTPRAIGERDVRRLAGAAREAGLEPVLVTRNAPIDDVALLAADGPAHVQLHGDEDGGYIASLRRLLPDEAEIWTAVPVSEEAASPRTGADRSLFDTGIGGRSGGTGQSFDWSLVSGRPDLATGILAGGIGPQNVRAAAATGAWAIDVGSSVESRPGRKDPAKVTALFAALRPAGRRDAA